MPFSKVIKRIGGSVKSAFGVIDKATEEKISIAEELAFQATDQVEHYDATGDINGLRRAISLTQGAMNIVNEGFDLHMFERNDYLGEFVHDLLLDHCLNQQKLFLATNDPKILEETIEKMRPVFDVAPKPSRAYILEGCFMARTYVYRYFVHGEKDESDVREGVEIATSIVAASKKWKNKIELSSQDLDAVSYARQLVDLPLDYAKGVYLHNRASSLKSQFVAKRDIKYLELARTCFAGALALFPTGDDYHTKAAVELADCEVNYIDRTNDITNLQSALDSICAIDLQKLNQSEFVNAAITKSMLYRAKFDHTSERGAIEAALELARAAAHTPTNNINHRIISLTNYSRQSSRRGELTVSKSDIDTSIEAARAAIKECPEGVRLSGAYADLGARLGTKYSIFGGGENLQASIEPLRNAVAALPKDHGGRASRLHNLALALRDVFTSTGDSAPLDESITLQREALSLISADDPARCVMLDGLSLSLNQRFKRKQNSEDMTEAISVAEEALLGTPKGHTRYPRRLQSLASIVEDRFLRKQEIADIDRAIELVTEAITLSEYDKDGQLFYRLTLASCLSSKFRVTKDLSDMDRAIKITREVIEQGSSRPQRGRWLMELGIMLGKRADSTEDLEEKGKYLREALGLQKECVELLSDTDPDMGSFLCTLGTRYAQLNELVPKEDEEQLKSNIELAIAACRKGLDHPSALPYSQIQNAKLSGSSYIWLQDWKNASEVLSQAIQIFNKLSPPSLDENDRQHQLHGLTGMAMDACMAYLMQGREAEALEILEAGRGVMANIAMRSHDQLPTLREQSLDLHREYTELRQSLSQALSTEKNPSMDPVAKRSKDQARFEELEVQIRKLPGLESFNKNMTAKQMQRLADKGPIVSFCVAAGYRSCALIVTSDEIKALLLPDLDYTETEKKVPLITGDNRLSLRPPSKRPAANKQMRALLAWLWDTAVKPVLEYLNLLENEKGSLPPRLWWVTTGYLGLMPLHAAGKGSKTPKENVWSHVVSSYTSTFSALSFARECQSKVSSQPPNVALVTMPETAARSSLNTEGEAQAVREAFLSPSNSSQDDGTLVELLKPTSAEVLQRVRGSNIDIFHLSCHAEPDLKDPSNTSFLFGNDPTAAAPDPLPIQSLRKYNSSANLSLQAPQLAYLSACCTAQQYDLKLLDENISLAAILQLIGFPAVVGTLWEADDKAAAFIAKVFYAELTRLNAENKDGGMERQDRLARALHEGTRACREAKFGRAKGSEDVLLWANFVHFGA